MSITGKSVWAIAAETSVYLMLFCCCIPPVTGFSDSLIMPKWFLGGAAFLFWIVTVCLKKRHTCSSRTTKLMADSLCRAAFMTSMAEMLFVAAEIICSGGIPDAGAQGTFDNPSGMSLFLCTLFPFAIHFTSRQSFPTKHIGTHRTPFITAIYIILFVAILLVSKSRTSLICAGCFVCIALVRYWQVKIRIKVLAGIFISAFIIGLCLFFKKDSTHGRQFILHVTWELIKEKPLAGHGHGGFHKEYMNRQKEYFLTYPQSQYARLADDVRHPLNEFMLAWCDYGIWGLCVIIAAFAFPLVVCIIKGRRVPVWLPGTVPIFIFSLFSYPFNYPLSWIILILCASHSLYAIKPVKKMSQKYMPCILNTTILVSLCLLAAVFCELYYDLAWGHLAKYAADGHPRKTLVRYASLYGHYHSNPYFLYNYAAVLYSAGMFTEAEEKIGECQKMWNGYNIELLAGDICRMEEKHNKARMHYRHAHQMCPSRFAPLFEIFQIYRTEEDTVNAARVARMIVCKSMKTKSAEIYEMRTIAGEFIRNSQKAKMSMKSNPDRHYNVALMGEEAFEFFREQTGKSSGK